MVSNHRVHERHGRTAYPWPAAIAVFAAIQLAIAPTALAFDSMSSSFESWLSYSLRASMAAPSFANSYSHWESLSTVSEFRNVKCKKVTDGNLTIDPVNVAGIILTSYESFQELDKLTQELDEIQFRLCLEMIPDGLAAELVIKIGEKWKLTLATGRRIEERFSYFVDQEQWIRQSIEDSRKDVSQLNETLKSEGVSQ